MVLGSLRTGMLVFASLLYVLVAMPFKQLLRSLKARPEATLLIRPGSGSVVVEPYAGGEIASLVYTWASTAGLTVNAHGRLLKRARSADYRGYVLSLAASLKSYFESRGYIVTVVLKRVFNEDLAAVLEVKKSNFISRVQRVLESRGPRTLTGVTDD